ncbi:MAG: hypothetical protein ACKOYM_00550, partial [Actinomycetes bacterium]
ASFRTGAFVTTRARLLAVGGLGGPGDTEALTEVGLKLLGSIGEDGERVTHTPEVLVRWNEREVGPAPEGDALRLRWALQGLDAVARSPIPDGDMLTRYATVGGVAAARLRDHREARRLLLLARRAQPEILKHWARWAVACVPFIADRIWLPTGTEPTESVDRERPTDSNTANPAEAQVMVDVRAGLDDVAGDVHVLGPLTPVDSADDAATQPVVGPAADAPR